MVIWTDFQTNGTRRILNTSALLGARFGSGAMRILGWISAWRWSGSEKISSLVFFLLRSGKRRTLNLQNRQYSPQFAIYGQKDDKSQRLRQVYVYFEEKYQHQHYPRYFALNTKLVIFPYKYFKFQTDCLGPLWVSLIILFCTLSLQWKPCRQLRMRFLGLCMWIYLLLLCLFFFFSIYLKKILRILPLKLIMRRLPDSFQSWYVFYIS